jgi:hypothetical protein
MIKIPPCSKAMSAEIYNPSPLMVTSPYNILERNIKKKQSPGMVTSPYEWNNSWARHKTIIKFCRSSNLSCVPKYSIYRQRIQARKDPPHTLVCRKMPQNGAGPSDETWKLHGMIKIPPCSKALSADIGLNFAALHRKWWRLLMQVKYSWSERKTIKLIINHRQWWRLHIREKFLSET